MQSKTERIAKQFAKIVKQVTGAEPTHGTEVGIWAGDFSKCLLEVCPELYLTMVDAWQPYDDSKLGRLPLDTLHDALRTAAVNTAHVADRRTMIVCSSERAAAMVPDGSQDLVYIDACHKYEFVKQDWGLWFPKVKNGGVFGGHDYDGRGDRRGWFGVKRAVDECCEKNQYTATKDLGNIWWIKKR